MSVRHSMNRRNYLRAMAAVLPAAPWQGAPRRPQSSSTVTCFSTRNGKMRSWITTARSSGRPSAGNPVSCR